MYKKLYKKKLKKKKKRLKILEIQDGHPFLSVFLPQSMLAHFL